MYLYYSMSKTDCEEIKPEYTVKTVSAHKKDRNYWNRMDYLWYLITFGKYKKIVVLKEETFWFCSVFVF